MLKASKNECFSSYYRGTRMPRNAHAQTRLCGVAWDHTSSLMPVNNIFRPTELYWGSQLVLNFYKWCLMLPESSVGGVCGRLLAIIGLKGRILTAPSSTVLSRFLFLYMVVNKCPSPPPNILNNLHMSI